jgi:hypothetical protein
MYKKDNGNFQSKLTRGLKCPGRVKCLTVAQIWRVFVPSYTMKASDTFAI